MTPALFVFILVISADGQNVDCDKTMVDRYIMECLNEKTAALDKNIEARITALADEAVSFEDDDNEINDKFRKSRKDEILSATQHWFAYRDAICLSDPDLNMGGTLGLVTHAYCRLELSEKQLKDLDKLLGH
jgi:hypothetical protein